MIAAAGLASFSGSFFLAWVTTSRPAGRPADSNQPTPIALGTAGELKLPPLKTDTVATAVAGNGEPKRTFTEKELKSLVYEVRQKIQEYNRKLKDLELREQRLQTAHATLKKDIENLNNMRVELASIIAQLKSERDKLLKSRVEISQAETTNLRSIAAAYDKMDASSASAILSSMCKDQVQGMAGGGPEDAVKILHYMTERTKANVLAEICSSEPQLAAVLCHKLKQIEQAR